MKRTNTARAVWPRVLTGVLITLVLLLFGLYYFGYYDLSFVRRPASWNRTLPDFLASLRPMRENGTVTEPPETRPVTQPDDTAAPEDTGTSSATEPEEPDFSFENVSALQGKGWMLTEDVYDGEQMKLGVLDLPFDLPRVKSYRLTTDYKLVYTFSDQHAADYNDRSVSYVPVTVDRNAVTLYMGYLIYDTGKTLYLIDNAGNVLTTLDNTKYHLANTRDTAGRPLFFEETEYTITIPAATEEREIRNEAGAVIGTETVELAPAHEETFTKYLYYYVDAAGNFVPSDYRDSTDGRGLSMDYPAAFGTSDDGSSRRVRLTEMYYTTLKGEQQLFDVTRWAYTSGDGSPRTGYDYTKAYAYREGRATTEYTYELSYTRSDGIPRTYTITAMAVLNEKGKVQFRPYSIYRYATWYVIEWLTFPDSFGEESLGFYYYDHGLMRARRQIVDYSDWVYNNRTLRILEDENILIDREGNEVQTPLGYTVEAYSDGMILLRSKEGLYAYFDYRLVRVTDPVYTDAFPFSEGLSAVRNQSGRWGVIDTAGNTVIPFEYTYISRVSGGLIACYKPGEWTVFQKMARQSADPA